MNESFFFLYEQGNSIVDRNGYRSVGSQVFCPCCFKSMDLRSRLIKRIHEEEVRLFASMAQSSFDDREFGEFFQLLYDEEARVAENVAWIMSHFNKAGRERLNSRKELIMAEAMRTSNATKLRLLLAIILRQPFSEEEIATPFLDFCFDNITSSAQPIAIKSLSIYLSFQQCKFFPELLQELEATLHSCDGMPLSPGLRNARTKVLQAIAKTRKDIDRNELPRYHRQVLS